ncbi:hypothetical protein ACQPZQ_40460 [Pseudonocardia sp. CA-142604]|uniref:hypothetical protein n=1 Tax=Pseudonocardia sp. CA-142604 TaxID=3240024 RepID=UPI003D94D4F2
MLTTPPTRLIAPADSAVPPCAAPAHPAAMTAHQAGTAPAHGPAACTVTTEQVERAVLQLRERPGMSAVEQIHAILRELGLTVAPPAR